MHTMSAPHEKMAFQAEVKQLLHLMIHSLYSNKEIFLRELVSNASDAVDKLRFEGIANPSLLEGGGELGIRIGFDAAARTITWRMRLTDWLSCSAKSRRARSRPSASRPSASPASWEMRSSKSRRKGDAGALDAIAVAILTTPLRHSADPA